MDTSYSNIDHNLVNDNFYILENLDGSGKLRASNYNSLLESSKEILHQYKPSDINIVLHSASGGTGSVIGPIIISELTSNGLLAFPIIVESKTSKIETINSLKTIQTYASMSKKLNKPICAIYKQNSKAGLREQIDNEIVYILGIMQLMFSGKNKELDLADIINFKDYHKVTDVKPKLTYVDLYVNDVIIPKGMHLISAVTLTDIKTNGSINIPVEYQAIGYVQEDYGVKMPVHLCNIEGHFNSIIEDLNNSIKEYEEAARLYTDKPLIDDNVNSDNLGMVL